MANIFDLFEIPEELLGNKRKDYLDNDTAAMLTALIWSGRSKDPSSQVGACIINEEGRVLSIGYNGTPNNWHDDKFPWDRQAEDSKFLKYINIHAEMNAICNYNGSKNDFNGSTAYVTLFPCSNCAKLLIQHGIAKIVYLSDKYNNLDDVKCSKKLLQECGIEVISFEELVNGKPDNIEIDYDKKDEEPVKIRHYTNQPQNRN